MTWIMIFWLKYENKKLDEQFAGQNLKEQDLSNEEPEHAPERFRYII